MHHLCLQLAINLQQTTLKLLFIPSCIWMKRSTQTPSYHSLLRAADSQPLTSAALSLMNPSHCSAAFQSPEGTVLLAMQSSQYAVLSKCFSALTFSGRGHLSASARCTLPGLIMLAWHWISNQCHATCWSNHWAMVCIGTLRYTGVHVEHEKQAMIQALFGCKVSRYISKDTYMLFKLNK